MKLIIQIPCLNEEHTLPLTIKDLPRSIPQVSIIEYLVIDDGSTDNTVEVAKSCGVHHIVKIPKQKGLANAFRVGLDACLKLGADIIVNTDGDNQYFGGDIPKLVEPILQGNAEIVIGDRETDNISHFSITKKRLQKFGSWVVRQASDTDVPDTTSGFRAYSREAAFRMFIISDFTYTLETIIQGGRKNLSIAHVPVRTNSKLRDSRLFKGIWNYVKRSAGTILRIYTMYRPLKVFLTVGGLFFSIGFFLGIRFLYYFLTGFGQGHIQSLILASILMILGFQLASLGVIADLVAANRKILEEIIYKVRKIDVKVNCELHDLEKTNEIGN